MDRLYAPWRMKYIRQGDLDRGDCFLCTKRDSDKDRENLALFSGEQAGDCDFDMLSDDEILEIGKITKMLIAVLRKTMNAQGFNVGFNIGRVAGAGCDTHVHQHIVPRWNGDTNFMPVLADIKVIPEAIEETYDLLKRALDAEGSDYDCKYNFYLCPCAACSYPDDYVFAACLDIRAMDEKGIHTVMVEIDILFHAVQSRGFWKGKPSRC